MTILTNTEQNAELKAILKDFLKVIKVVSMYPEDNTLPQSLRQSFAERLSEFVYDHGALAVGVEKDSLLVDDEPILQNVQGEDGLTNLFFQNGIQNFTFESELEIGTVLKLLSIFKIHLNRENDSEDMAELLWQADLPGFSFETIEDYDLLSFDSTSLEMMEMGRWSRPDIPDDAFPAVAPYENIFTDSGIPEENTAEDEDVLNMIGLSGPEETGPAIPSLFDFNTEAEFSRAEEREIEKLLAEDARFDYATSVVELLKEMLLQDSELTRFSETIMICEKVLIELVQANLLTSASDLLKYLTELEEKLESEQSAHSNRLKDARVTMGSRESMALLGETLNKNKDVDRNSLLSILNCFNWEALSSIADLLGECDHRHHREALCDYLAQKGRERPNLLAKGVYDKRWYVVRNTVAILARIGNEQSIRILQHAAGHEERRVRLELVSQLYQTNHPMAFELLGQAVFDADPEIRHKAIDTLTSQKAEEAFDTIAEIIEDPDFLLIDQHDQGSLMKTYSRLGGERAVHLLLKLIRPLNPFRLQIKSFNRQAAFEALSHNKSEKAEKQLQRLLSSWRPDIRRRAQLALQVRTELVEEDR
ncbi:MAG: HEAT repeat domain-containing protein [candidate division Zixibacteria bacterium]|nr:HEAT repeat domain-containing protein [candidate division Zixibacteria bacterium]